MKGNSEKKSYDYYAFGEMRDEKTFGNLQGFYNRYKFTSREWDGESANYYYRARQYNQNIGRFISRDPMGYGYSLNLYSYALNNPIMQTDPFGLCPNSMKHLANESTKKECGISGYMPVMYGKYPLCLSTWVESFDDMYVRYLNDPGYNAYSEEEMKNLSCPTGKRFMAYYKGGSCDITRLEASQPCEIKLGTIEVIGLELTGKINNLYNEGKVIGKRCGSIRITENREVDICTGEYAV